MWIAVCSGMGANAARRAFAAAEAEQPLDLVLSVGWAGAIMPDIQPGSAYTMSLIIDAQTGERFQLTDGNRKMTVITMARVADASEKARLQSAYPGAVVVDMEAAAVARMAQIRGIPVACIKGVSDGVGADLPDINRFIGASGQLRLTRFLGYLALRPRYWGEVMRLGKYSKKAARAIYDLILEFMQEKNVDRLNRTGSP